ncbi:MAG: hypothetical protein QJR03_05780 [Sphaerobacter sp.]|nr:hypothetical protein [Sphaerobacter sp.]
MTRTRRRATILARASAALLILAALFATLALPAAAQEYAGWEFRLEPCQHAAGFGSAGLTAGPGIPPLGSGSLTFDLADDGTGFPQFRHRGFDGVALATLTRLSYSSYVAMSGDLTVAPLLLLDVDIDGDGQGDDQLVFQPGQQGAALASYDWQSWDALQGRWWSRTGQAGMSADAPQPLATYLESFPQATIASPDGRGGLRLAAGCLGDGWAGFTGAIDALSIGVGGRTTTYDFEPGRVVVNGATPPGRVASAPVFDQLTPAPFSRSAPGSVTIGVDVHSDSPIRSVTLTLNGQNLPEPPITVVGNSATARATRSLAAGVYSVTATATDADGDRYTAQWDFVVGAAGESQWFTASGAPKPDQINATLRSLVEAFRWHLLGQSWDGAAHPEIPTHGTTVTQAPAVGTWVTRDGFDQAATEATLRSLVESFRWHFWGVSWDGGDHADVPTHATQILPQQGIDPWFDEDGKPIRANIEATLRSLVEAFRWHFWGVSWDGQHHESDMPTHG